MKDSATGIGLRDWLFNASTLVKDCADEIEADSMSLHQMLESIYQAAAVLDDDNWKRFTELTVDRVHCQDLEVHGALFARAEVSWRPMLTTPKSGTTCVFLHIGTEPPTGVLCDMLTKMGWFGVCVGPSPPPPGNEDLIEYIKLDPSSDQDRLAFKALADKSGGLLPKPSQFLLVFVNTVFGIRDPEPPSDEELGAFTGEGTDDVDTLEERPKSRAEKRPRSQARRGALLEAPKNLRVNASVPEQLTTAAGYGLLGVTRSIGVRKRLRALNHCISVALARLKSGGTLVLLWPGLPCHPVLFWLTANLRNLFMRVHVVALEGIKTFEIYILCASFNREKANDNIVGETGSALKSFFSCAYRRPALDDVLLWTLPSKAEYMEAFFGVGGKSKQKTYDELWSVMSQKYKALAQELDVDVTKASRVERERELLQKERRKKGEDAKEGAKDGKKAAGKADASKKEKEKADTPARKGKADSPKRERDARKASKGRHKEPKHAKSPAPPAAAAADTDAGPEPASPAAGADAGAAAAAVAPPPASPAPSPAAAGAGGGHHGGGPVQAEPSSPKKLPGPAAAPPSPAAPAAKAAAGATAASPAAAPTTPAAPGPAAAEPAAESGGAAAAAAAASPAPGRTGTGGSGRLQAILSGETHFLHEEEASPPRPRRHVFSLSRSVPSLACSLGAAPGSLGASRMHADRQALAAQWALIQFGTDVAEQKFRRWHRKRDDLGVSLAGLPGPAAGATPPRPQPQPQPLQPSTQSRSRPLTKDVHHAPPRDPLSGGPSLETVTGGPSWDALTSVDALTAGPSVDTISHAGLEAS